MIIYTIIAIKEVLDIQTYSFHDYAQARTEAERVVEQMMKQIRLESAIEPLDLVFITVGDLWEIHQTGHGVVGVIKIYHTTLT